eukprot:SAG31_NODE_534_length_14370_cov_121.217434_9_plen_57_part_00
MGRLLRLCSQADLIDQLALWLSQYGFLDNTALHLFAQSFIQCTAVQGELADLDRDL